jgi:hypothetical protein
VFACNTDAILNILYRLAKYKGIGLIAYRRIPYCPGSGIGILTLHNHDSSANCAEVIHGSCDIR